MYIEPWEKIAYGLDDIKKAIKGNEQGYRFKVFQGDMITKEIRLWKKEHVFKNPVFECITIDEAKETNVVLYSKVVDRTEHQLELVRHWKNSFPIDAEPYYYEACIMLSKGKYDEFLSAAHAYLFKDDKSMTMTMINFYCAYVYCYIKKDASLAIRHLMPCILANPLMAEFWCLLGDIYYMILKKYDKAKAFYENALFLGSKRLKDDLWPMDIKKYKDFPEKMIKSCDKIISKEEILGARDHS
jgi:tetratricopeptide (TPR) repeat protein